MSSVCMPGTQHPAMDGWTPIGASDPALEIDATAILARRDDTVPVAQPLGHPALSDDEFCVLYGGCPVASVDVASYFTDNGIEVVETDLLRRTMSLHGTIAQFNAALGIDIQDNLDADGVVRRSHGDFNVAPLVAAAIIHITGVGAPPQPTGSVTNPPGMTAVTPQQLMTAYNLPTNRADGQVISLWGFGYSQSDVNATWANWGITETTTVNKISVDGTATTGGNVGEGNLDVALSWAFGRGATLAMWFGVDIVAIMPRIVYPKPGDPRTTIISFSAVFLGNPEGDFPAYFQSVDAYFRDATARGVGSYMSTGDWGSSNISPAPGGPQPARIGYPCGSAYVTAVGGTVISLNPFAEWSWEASGGGISALWPVPSYQAGYTLPVSVTPGQPAGRAIPDISGNASPGSGFISTTAGVSGQVGGTSVTAPMYAGIAATINAALGVDVGFWNPYLYAIGTDNNIIRDVTFGDGNAWFGAPGYLPKVGYDCVTGLGVINGNKFLAYLRARLPNTYVIEYSSDGGVTFQKALGGLLAHSVTYFVGGLNPNTTYVVQVTVHNLAKGTSNFVRRTVTTAAG